MRAAATPPRSCAGTGSPSGCLIDVLKVPWSQVHEEAGRLEHAISPWLEEHLVTLLGDPATCPHGNPDSRLGEQDGIR